MTTYYTLKNGEKISIFFWDDYYTGREAFHIPIEVTEIDISGSNNFTSKKAKDIRYHGEMCALTHKLRLHTDSEGRHYILWKEIPVYLEDFDYYSIAKVIEEVEYGMKVKDEWYINNDVILTSLMKQPDKFGVELKPRKIDFIFPGTLIGVVGDRVDNPIIYIPKIEPLREVKNWFYKIKLHAKDEELRSIVATEEYYFSSFCSLLKKGVIKLVEI